MKVRTKISRFPAPHGLGSKLDTADFPAIVNQDRSMTFYCACFPHLSQSFSLSIPPCRWDRPSYTRIFFPPWSFRCHFLAYFPRRFSLSVSLSWSISHIGLSSLSLFLSTDRRLFLKLLFDAIRASYIHPHPFVFPWPAISWRINCFVSFRYERRMNGTSSWCFFYYFVRR